MRFLNKIGVRIVVAIIAGQMTNEKLSVSSANAVRFTGFDNPLTTFIYAFIIYLLLTGIAKGFRKKPLPQPVRYILKPEVPGELGEHTIMDTSVHPPVVSHLHLIIKGWLGDDLLKNFPVFLVTKTLGAELVRSTFTGFKLSSCIVEGSEEFEVFFPETELPDLFWLEITAKTDTSDFCLDDKNNMSVSENAFAFLSKFSLKYCDIVKK